MRCVLVCVCFVRLSREKGLLAEMLRTKTLYILQKHSRIGNQELEAFTAGPDMQPSLVYSATGMIVKGLCTRFSHFG